MDTISLKPPGALLSLQDHLRRTSERIASPEVILGLVFFVVSLLSVLASRADRGIALIWPGNAIAAALLIRMHKMRWIAAAGSILLAGVLANRLSGGDSWALALGFALINLFEIAVTVATFRYAIRYPYPDISIWQACVMTLLMGLTITAATAALGGALFHQAVGAPFLPIARGWWMADALGACLFGPPIILYSRERFLRLVRPRYLAANVLVALTCIGATWFAIRYVRFPFVVIALVPMAAAFQVGSFGTAVLGVCNAVTVAVLWTLGIEPMGLESVVHGSSLQGLPFLAVLFAVMPPVAVGLGTDARRQAVRSVRASEQRFRESMEHSPLGIIILGLGGNKLFSNEALHRMLGCSEAELREADLSSLAHPDELPDIQARWRRLVSQQTESYSIQRRFRHRSGKWIWAQCAVSLARDEEGRPMHFVAQIESLEERRRAEVRVAAERELLRTTLAAVGDAVITTDPAGTITYMNAAAIALTGRSFEAAEHRALAPMLGLTEADSLLPAEDLVERCIQEQRVVRRAEPCALQRPDGSVSYVCESVTPVFDAAHEATSLVIVLHDLTEVRERVRDLHHQANHDSLTGLLNRAAFDARVQKAFARARQSGVPAALIAIDLDRFKAVNDKAGHGAGDEVLRRVATVLRRATRPSDVVGRIGGDEFAVLLSQCNAARSSEIAQRLSSCLNPLRTQWSGLTHQTGASLGLAQWTEDFRLPQEWFEAADESCYEAKRSGRGTVRAWSRERVDG